MLFPSLARGERSPLGLGFSITTDLPVFHGLPPRVFVQNTFCVWRENSQVQGDLLRLLPLPFRGALGWSALSHRGDRSSSSGEAVPPADRSEPGRGGAAGAGARALSVVLQAPRPVTSRQVASPGEGDFWWCMPLGRCSNPGSMGVQGALLLRGAVEKCHGPGSIFPCCCKDSSLSRQVFLAALFYTRAKLHAWPWGYIMTLTPGCLRLRGTFVILSFSRAQHSICRCFWELIPTVGFSLGHVFVLQSTSLQGLWAEEKCQFFWGVGIVGSDAYANLPSYFFILIFPCKKNLSAFRSKTFTYLFPGSSWLSYKKKKSKHTLPWYVSTIA